MSACGNGDGGTPAATSPAMWGMSTKSSAPTPGAIAASRAKAKIRGEVLGEVDELAAAVVAPAGQALGILVRQPAALGLHDGGRGVVLGRDQLDLVVLTVALTLHRRPQLGVDLGDRGARTNLLRDRHRRASSCRSPSSRIVGSPGVGADDWGPLARVGAIFPRRATT